MEQDTVAAAGSSAFSKAARDRNEFSELRDACPHELVADAAVGDDTIQKQVSCTTNESGSHGSGQQWFDHGFATGDQRQCNTFAPRQYRRSMLIATTPDLPGRTFEVKGLVYAEGLLNALAGKSFTDLVQELATAATNWFGADAVIDVRVAMAGDGAKCVVTGTAVKLA